MGDNTMSNGYKYGGEGLGYFSGPRFGIRKDGTYGEIVNINDINNSSSGITDSLNDKSIVFKDSKLKLNNNENKPGLFDMNERGLTRFGSYLDSAATAVGLGTGLGSLYFQNKASKIDEKNQELAEKKANREFQNQDEAKARLKQFAKNSGGTY
jgi:hypothetical protein